MTKKDALKLILAAIVSFMVIANITYIGCEVNHMIEAENFIKTKMDEGFARYMTWTVKRSIYGRKYEMDYKLNFRTQKIERKFRWAEKGAYASFSFRENYTHYNERE